MRSFAWTARAAFVIVSGALVARVALADAPSESIYLRFRGGQGCPDEAAFTSLIYSRTLRARFVERALASRLFDVELRAGPPASGSVVVSSLQGPDGAAARRIEAPSCSDAADALSLIVALAIDPQAAMVVPPRESQEAPAQRDAGAVSPGDAGVDSPPLGAIDAGIAPRAYASVAVDAEPLADAVAKASPPPELPPRPVPPAAFERPSDRTRTKPKGSAGTATAYADTRAFSGAEFAAAFGVTPVAMWAVAPYFGIRTASTGLFAGSFRASFVRAATGQIAVPSLGGQSAHYTWTVGRADACLELRAHDLFRLFGCARVESGILEGAGDNVPSAQSQGSFWLSAGPLVRAEWNFIGPFVLNVAGSPMFHVTTDRFYFAPSTTVFHVPVVGAELESGLGLHFW